MLTTFPTPNAGIRIRSASSLEHTRHINALKDLTGDSPIRFVASASEQAIPKEVTDFFEGTAEQFLEFLVVAGLANERVRIQVQHNSAVGIRELINFAILLSKESERLQRDFLVD